jgi:hypothetical protein
MSHFRQLRLIIETSKLYQQLIGIVVALIDGILYFYQLEKLILELSSSYRI